MARLLRRRVWPVLVVELLVILRLRHYALVQLLHGVDVDDVDVAIAEIALRAEVDREIEEIDWGCTRLRFAEALLERS